MAKNSRSSSSVKSLCKVRFIIAIKRIKEYVKIKYYAKPEYKLTYLLNIKRRPGTAAKHYPLQDTHWNPHLEPVSWKHRTSRLGCSFGHIQVSPGPNQVPVQGPYNSPYGLLRAAVRSSRASSHRRDTNECSWREQYLAAASARHRGGLR